MKSHSNQAGQVISLDIGSTFTKAALFQVEPDSLKVVRSAGVPTTPDLLKRGVYEVLQKLQCLSPQTDRPICPVFYSSSAKGGLHVVAVGIVPELTRKVARQTATSAGARVTRSFGYKLSSKDIREIENLNPDMILLCGGTDGGNEAYVCHNARLLATLNIRPQIIYAGNRVLHEEIELLMSGFPLHITANILPELDTPCVDRARKKICDVFLETIVSGKGLDDVIDWLGPTLLPTPLAVMHLVEQLPLQITEWTDFCALDVGGATTDFYSFTRYSQTQPNVIYRGVHEPDAKRTVEGDLGIRTNAPSVLMAGSKYLQESKSTDELLEMLDYVDKISRQTDSLPRTERERSFDRILAEICTSHAVRRHVGTQKRVYTEHGEMFVQTGKDLRAVRKMILTGGFFSSLSEQEIKKQPLTFQNIINPNSDDTISLMPQQVSYYQDKEYLMPLLGNLVSEFPAQACRTFISKLIRLPSHHHQPLESTC